MSAGAVDLEALRALAVSAAEAAGAALVARGEAFQGVAAEAGRDIKLHADRAAEALIVERLRSGSPHAVLGEETGWQGAPPPDDRTPYWVVDPLDGSANYDRRIPICAVSIALMRGTSPVLGVIHDFHHGETFTGGEGQPAACNGTPIRVSDISEPARAVLVTGLPVQSDYSDAALGRMARDFARWKKVRMIGSAAMASVYVASGRADRYAEAGTRLWDVAAGLAIVAAAGGRVFLSDGPADGPRRVSMDNGHLPA